LKPNPFPGEFRTKPFIHRMHVIQRVKSAADARLIRHDEQDETRIPQALEGGGGAWKHLQFGGVAKVFLFEIEGPVAVKKNGAFHGAGLLTVFIAVKELTTE